MKEESRSLLTEGELEIMQVIWDLKQCTVRQVYEALRERRPVAYTTVMTMMKILEEKGHLMKNSDGRAHVYRPSQPKRKVIASLVADFVARVFQGSPKPLVMNLVQEQMLTQEDLEEINRMIQEQS